ncbi:MAG: hypothetical protein AAF492_13570, partial [Verrucomicrobiota bacterium]
MKEHLHTLTMNDAETYLAWCRTHGFKVSLEKSSAPREREIFFHRKQKAVELLKQSRKRKHKSHIIERLFSTGTMDEAPFTVPVELHVIINRHRDIYILKPFLLHLASCSRLLTDPDIIMALGHLVAKYQEWIRRYNSWKPTSHNVQRQFASLLRHLLAEYPIPAFMDSCWIPSNRHGYHDWYIHVAQGGNIRTAPGLPLRLTKKMAHFFLKAPADFDIGEALRWGQVHALGGNELIARALRGTSLCTQFEHDEFWLSVIRFFIAHPMLDRHLYGPVIDYLRHQKFE